MNLTMVRGSTPSPLRLLILQSIVVPVHEKDFDSEELGNFSAGLVCLTVGNSDGKRFDN